MVNEIGYESLFRPGGLQFAINAIKVSVPEEQQKGLILRLCNIVLLVIDYCKEQYPAPPKRINAYELGEKIAADERRKKEIQEAGIEEAPPR